jgi:hypothetical protein
MRGSSVLHIRPVHVTVPDISIERRESSWSFSAPCEGRRAPMFSVCSLMYWAIAAISPMASSQRRGRCLGGEQALYCLMSAFFAREDAMKSSLVSGFQLLPRMGRVPASGDESAVCSRGTLRADEQIGPCSRAELVFHGRHPTIAGVREPTSRTRRGAPPPCPRSCRARVTQTRSLRFHP